jgi:DNA-binding transcriptional ArsR family regulator
MSSTDDAKRPRMEVSSEQLFWELVEIKERVGALENVAAIVNSDAIAAHVEKHLTGKVQRKRVLQACEKPQSAEQLVSELGFKSRQALDHHLDPLRDEGLVHVRKTASGLVFEYSALVKKLSKSRLARILAGS